MSTPIQKKPIKLIIKGYKLAFMSEITQQTAAQIIAFIEVKKSKPCLK